MTLVAGVRCHDGFVIAADTALTSGDSFVFHGRKLDYYHGANDAYRVAVTYAGDLNFARATSQHIRDKVASVPINDISLKAIKDVIRAEVLATYTNHIYKFFSTEGKIPDFSLMIAMQVGDEFDLAFTASTELTEIGPYAFEGSGADIAIHLAERLLSINTPGTHVSMSVAAAMHVIQAIYHITKTFDGAVGRNTEIIGWRTSYSPNPFVLFKVGQPLWKSLWAFDNYLRYAIDTALSTNHQSTEAKQLQITSICDGVARVTRSLHDGIRQTLGEMRAVRLIEGGDGASTAQNIDDTSASALLGEASTRF